MFNALEYIRNLEAVGVRRDQAEVHVQLVLDAIGEELATKQDIADLKSEISGVRSELKAEIAELRSELKVEIAEVRSDIANVRTSMAELKSDLLVKLGGTMIGSISVATCILGYLMVHH